MRWEAAEDLEEMEEHAEALLPALLELLKGMEREPMLLASWVLSEIDPQVLAESPQAEQNLPRYIESIQGEDGRLRGLATAAVGAMGEKGAPAVPAIIESCKRLKEIEDPVERSWAGVFVRSSVVGIGPASFRHLVEAMRSDDRATRLIAAGLMSTFCNQLVREDVEKELGHKLEFPEEAIPPLLRMLERDGVPGDSAVVALLAAYGPKAKAAVPRLLEMLSPDRIDALVDGDWKVLSRELWDLKELAMAIARIDAGALHASAQARDLAPILRRALARDGYQPSVEAAQALGALGPPAADTVPLILRRGSRAQQEWSGRGNTDRLSGFARAAAEIGEAALPKLIEALGDDDRHVREGAAHALYYLGPSARAAEAALQKVSEEDPDEQVRTWAAVALDAIRREPSDVP